MLKTMWADAIYACIKKCGNLNYNKRTGLGKQGQIVHRSEAKGKQTNWQSGT